MWRHFLLIALVLGLSRTVNAAELKPATVAAFDHYVQLTEQRMPQSCRARSCGLTACVLISATPATAGCAQGK
jgi:hypothetical protein